MELGFNSLKDVLDVIVIPLVLAILALAWPAIQTWYRQLAFKGLILRELEELKPYPDYKQQSKNWWDHQKKLLSIRRFSRIQPKTEILS